MATYLAANRAILITAKNKPIKQLDELRGRNLAIFDPLGLVVLQSQQWLEDRGFELGRDYRTTLFPSHNSVGFSVQQGESLMGVIAPAGLLQLPPETREQIQVFAELPQVPACDKPRGAGKQALIRGFPNGETQPARVTLT